MEVLFILFIIWLIFGRGSNVETNNSREQYEREQRERESFFFHKEKEDPNSWR